VYTVAEQIKNIPVLAAQLHRDPGFPGDRSIVVHVPAFAMHWHRHPRPDPLVHLPQFFCAGMTGCMEGTRVRFRVGDPDLTGFECPDQRGNLSLIARNGFGTENHVIPGCQIEIWMGIHSQALQGGAHLTLAAGCQDQSLGRQQVA
jgi:hypothetical protein